MKTTTIRGAALAAALAAVALSVAACGSSSDGGGGATVAAAGGTTTTAPGDGTTTGPADGRASSDDRARLTACLKEQSVELPERPAGGPGGAGGDGPPPQGRPPQGAPGRGAGSFGGALSDAERRRLAAAFEACGARFGMRGGPRGGPGAPGSGGRPSTAALRRYVACVRRNGYDLPDPNTSGDGPVFDSDTVDRDDPAFVKASRACESLLRPSS